MNSILICRVSSNDVEQPAEKSVSHEKIPCAGAEETEKSNEVPVNAEEHNKEVFGAILKALLVHAVSGLIF